MNKNNDKHWTLKQGQAGVYRVASQLLLRGVGVYFPAVDLGADLITVGGVRIQVKSAHLSGRGRYPEGAYWFRLKKMRSVCKRLIDTPRTFSDECEFVVLWGIDHDNFWIVPSPVLDGCQLVAVARNNQSPSRQTLARWKSGETTKPRAQQVFEYENKWDLISSAVGVQLEDEAVTI